MVDRHFGSLTHIVLDVFSTVQTKSLQTILFNCSMLEILEVTRVSPEKSKISLEDAVAKPWATSKLRKLYLAVDIGDNDALLRDRRDPSAWLQDDIRKGQLERLFREIGKLIELRSLELRVAMIEGSMEDEEEEEEEEEMLTYKSLFFPGMFTLYDASAGRQGFLGLLAGLKSLQILWGSLAVGHSDSGLVMSQSEVEWMVEQWPRLRDIDFHIRNTESGTEVRSCLLWLQRQLPRLKIQALTVPLTCPQSYK